MYKKSIVITIAMVIVVLANAQDIKKVSQDVKTKMEAFVSKTGIIIKYIDVQMPALKLSFGDIAATRIRKIINGSESMYFYQISKEGKYSSNTASIEHRDLVETIKAIKVLKSQQEQDVSSNPDYLENKFTTSDGFQVGYYVSKGRATWFVKLERYGSDNTLFLKESDDIETTFTEAKKKIEELKNNL